MKPVSPFELPYFAVCIESRGSRLLKGRGIPIFPCLKERERERGKGDNNGFLVVD